MYSFSHKNVTFASFRPAENPLFSTRPFQKISNRGGGPNVYVNFLFQRGGRPKHDERLQGEGGGKKGDFFVYVNSVSPLRCEATVDFPLSIIR